MSPNLLFHPVSDKRKAFARIAYGKIVHPSAKDRVDLVDHPPYGLADVLSEDLLELRQQRRPFLWFGRVVWSPLLVTAEDAAIFKTQERKTSSVCQINDFALLFVYLYFELRQFFSQSFVHRLSQPIAARMGVDQYHHVICETRVLNMGISLASSSLNRRFQHFVYLVEVEVAEHRRDHTALRN